MKKLSREIGNPRIWPIYQIHEQPVMVEVNQYQQIKIQLQGFRFTYKGQNPKRKWCTPSMSMGKNCRKEGFGKDYLPKDDQEKLPLKLMGKTVGL